MTAPHWICVGLLVAELALIAWLLVRDRRLRAEVAASRGWPAVPGRVVATEVRTYGTGKYKQYDAVVSYEYEAGGYRFSSERLYFGERMMFGSRRRAERRLEGYAPATALQVFHDPVDPARAIVEQSAPVLRRDLWLLALLAALFAGTIFLPQAI